MCPRRGSAGETGLGEVVGVRHVCGCSSADGLPPLGGEVPDATAGADGRRGLLLSVVTLGLGVAGTDLRRLPSPESFTLLPFGEDLADFGDFDFLADLVLGTLLALVVVVDGGDAWVLVSDCVAGDDNTTLTDSARLTG